ncbi:MAG: outer membrane porin, OprD family [Sulfurimonas sp.]|nr:outer membrane porin, OprD family [Sulfurimonas sp.]MBU1216686.1 OprD family outer membrane porin [bacterium]MBU1434813.1 OprD family outer membrane porin [bacterium]MBU1503918.1 OprD family outer membrane porin [bacterium]MBU3938724.1 OprD family outer membrane porin [bacterium]
MLDGLYLAQEEIKQQGLIHTKVSGRYEIVQELPKDANTFDEIFNYADAYGNIRFAYIDDVHKASASATKEQKSASAIGGEIGIKTAEYNGFSFNISAYVSQSIGFLSPQKEDLNPDFVNLNQDSFAYIAQASLNYEHELFQAKLGRIQVETPYANSDDIRMAANTFEGAFAKIDYSANLSSQIMFLNRWAGYDSQDTLSQDVFKELYEDSKGVGIASLTYEYARNSELSFWVNHIDNMSQIAYAEMVGIFFIDGDAFHLDYGVQGSSIRELGDSGIEGNVYGLMSIIHYNGAFLGISYNKAFVDTDKKITDGFGGGPYYTSLDEATIAAMSEAVLGEDVEAFRIGGGYDLKQIGSGALNGFMLELVYGKLQSKDKSVNEKDIILSYEIADKWYVEGIYTKFDAPYEGKTFDRTLVRANYSF